MKNRRNQNPIGPDEIALIASKTDGKPLRLLVPGKSRDNMQMSRMQLFLGMVLLKSKDQAFVDRIIAEYPGPTTKPDIKIVLDKSRLT